MADSNERTNPNGSIDRVLSAAGRRLLVVDLLATSAVTLTAALVLVTLLRGAHKLIAFELPFGWGWVLGGAVVAALVAAVVWSVVRRKRGVDLAIEVDERAGLRESLSTAVTLSGRGDAWSRAVVQSADERARKVVVRDAVPVEAPRLWPMALGAALALAVVWFLPRQPIVLGGTAGAGPEEEAELRQVMAETERQEEEIKALLARTNVAFDEDDAGEEGDPDAALLDARDPVQVRREALKKMTAWRDQLEEAQQGGEQAQFEQTLEQMRQLRDPGQGPMTEFGREMARGNFKDAKEALDRFLEDIDKGELTQEQKEQAKEQLKKLAEQMEKIAEQRQELVEQLQQAGMSEQQAQQAAQSAEGLQQALEGMQGMSDQQKQQMQQAAEAMDRASQATQGMASAMSQMAQNMNPQGMSPEGRQAAEQLADQLSQMEMSQQDMQAMQTAMQELDRQMQQLGQSMSKPCEGEGCEACANGTCSGQGDGKNGLWRSGQSEGKRGNGSGGPGQGTGDGPEGEAVDFMLKNERADVQTKGGPIIGQTVVYGNQVIGESRATFGAAVEAGSAEAAEAIETRRVPRKHEKAVQHYFGRLEAAAREGGEDAPASSGDDSE